MIFNLCPSCVLARVSFRELITAAALYPLARGCHSLGIHRRPSGGPRSARVFAPALALLALGVSIGCSAAPPPPPLESVRVLRGEIAALGSMAKVPGPRSSLERSRIDQDVRVALVHVDEIAPAWSGR